MVSTQLRPGAVLPASVASVELQDLPGYCCVTRQSRNQQCSLGVSHSASPCLPFVGSVSKGKAIWLMEGNLSENAGV